MLKRKFLYFSQIDKAYIIILNIIKDMQTIKIRNWNERTTGDCFKAPFLNSVLLKHSSFCDLFYQRIWLSLLPHHHRPPPYSRQILVPLCALSIWCWWAFLWKGLLTLLQGVSKWLTSTRLGRPGVPAAKKNWLAKDFIRISCTNKYLIIIIITRIFRT